MDVKLGVNNCFAVKRWPVPCVWSGIIQESFSLDLVQFSLDLISPCWPDAAQQDLADQVRRETEAHALRISSTFTGLAAYCSNMLLHPNISMRMDALKWYENMVEFSACIGARTTGGHLGALSCEDFNNGRRREYLTDFFIEAIEHLSVVARREGLVQLLLEPMPVLREGPVTIGEAERLFERINRDAAVPIRYCLYLGHQCTYAVSSEDSDPYHWLSRIGPLCTYVHLQQNDGSADRHWPFTDEYNRQGLIDPERVIESLERSGAEEVNIVFEIIHPFEETDETVLEDLRQSVDYWRQYLT